MDPRVPQLQAQVASLAAQVSSLSQTLRQVLSNPALSGKGAAHDSMFNSNLNGQAKIAFQKYLGDAILDFSWDGYFYHNDLFVDINRWTTGGSGNVNIDNYGLYLQANNNSAIAFLDLFAYGILNNAMETRARTMVNCGTTSQANYDLVIRFNSSTSGYYGFEFKNGTIYGIT